MTNDIGGIGHHPTQPAGKRESRHDRTDTAAKQPDGSHGSTPDRVTLTGPGLQRQAMETAASAGEPVDRDRIEAIRSAINNGTYAVNAEAVAQKMLELDQQLFGKT